MSLFLYRLGRFATHHRRVVGLGWVVVLLLVVATASAFGSDTSEDFTIPGTESQRAFDLLDQRFPEQSGSTARAVFATSQGTLDDPDRVALVSDTVERFRALPGVVDVTEPINPITTSRDGRIAFAEVRYPVPMEDVGAEAVDALIEAAAPARAAGLTVEFGGDVLRAAEQPETRTAEMLGLGAAVVVLLLAFGSVVAMGLPLVTALVGLAVTLTSLGILASFTDLSSSAPTLATMIGIAVGIDYALFIVSRHRQHLAEGMEPDEAAARANATAGSAVVFAGATVVIAISGLAVLGIPWLTAMGFASAIAVAVAVALAVTLLPALLSFLGPRIDRLKVPGVRVRVEGAIDGTETLGARWARRVTARPWRWLAAGLAILALLAAPALDMRLGIVDAGSNPPSSTQRRAYDLLADGFGPGFNGPLALVTDLSAATDAMALNRISNAVKADPGVGFVAPPFVNRAGDTAVVMAVPRTGPADAATEALVHRLRREVLPEVEAITGAEVAVTGSTAAFIDVADKLGGALVPFMALVIGLTVLLLLVVFRSVVVPLKAAGAILLSIASSFGVVVAVFQDGWLLDLVGLEETVPIVAFLPVMMFSILFGLSMDYEVFILSRIREDWSRTGEPRSSVLSGLAASARVITAAAAIMVSVFAGFVLGEDPVIKMFGVGLAVAVLLDATIVRMVVVPAVMTLLGRAAWWLPASLDRRLPDLDIEGERLLERLDEDERVIDLDREAEADAEADAVSRLLARQASTRASAR